MQNGPALELADVTVEPAANGAQSIFPRAPFIIAIAGGTASGKTTVCQRITQALGDQSVVLLSLDEFYRDLTPEESANIAEINFDEPAAFDIKTVATCLDALRRCESVEVPIYDFVTSKRKADVTRHVTPADVVVIEGILALHVPEILDRCNMRIFVDTDDDVRLARRIRRDTVERGRDVEGVLSQYTRFVKPAFEKYVLPSKQHADVIIPWMNDNTVAVNLITEHIRSKLSVHDLRRIYTNLHVMPSTMQTRGMHTKIRCRTTSRTDFVFYADRLIRLVVEAALGKLPFENTTVTTPSGDPYQGVNFCPKLCGVSIIRSGEAMENALRACCHGIKIGKVLIHRTGDNGQTLAYEKLPHDIAERHVLLMDPILATGGSAVRAIEVLTKHRSVDESKIILLTLIAAPQGIHKVCSHYPRLKVITTEIDDSTGPDNTVRPGIGDFGDRYFGTSSGCVEHLIMLSPKPHSSDEESST
mmetsp:Transcript_88471/g.245720  ORF Transcript_88471/g.245720 Transcript_88471/m.245720 type:complete len:474 (+) Transcript_88471:68-1489(+)